jgi:hypothetical protein
MASKATIKTYFETGDVPTQAQFESFIDSTVFVDENPVMSVTGTTVDNTDPQNPIVNVPTLLEVTTAGATSLYPITTAGISLQSGNESVDISTTGQIDVTPDTTSPTLKTTIQFDTPTGNNQYAIPDKGGATDTFAMLSDITGGGAVNSVNGQTGTVVLDATDVNALQRDGSNANSDIDISSGGYKMNAASFHAKGTSGNGHYAMKHQSSGATASASESVIYADNSGNPQWKNDGSAVERVLLQSNITQTITNGITDKAPSEDAVFDSLALKAALSQAAYSMLANNTSGTANMAATTFKAIAKQTYSPAVNPSWTGTTPPSGATQHSYSWQQVGNVVTFSLTLFYATAGSALTQVVCQLPSDMPVPVKPDGISATSDIICMLVGQMSSGSTLSTLQGRSALRIDSSSTSAYQLVLAQGSAGYKVAWISGSYLTA